jgi:HAD superfamily hydrolase (TIGR01509 family)
MPAILFGSIGTIADTSELQRQSFNKAFALHNLDWHWSRAEYMSLLEKSGGTHRIEEYARSRGQSVDVSAIHHSKSEIFQKALREDRLVARPGVVDVMQKAKQNGLKLALVTGTSEQNVLSMLDALRNEIDANDFDLVLNSSKIQHPKPAKDAYEFALRELNQMPHSCVAIENNVDGLTSAKAAGLACIAFPDENTTDHTFEGASLLVNHLEFEQLQRFL